MHLILGGNMISAAEIKNHEMPESSAVVHNIAIYNRHVSSSDHISQ